MLLSSCGQVRPGGAPFASFSWRSTAASTVWRARCRASYSLMAASSATLAVLARSITSLALSRAVPGPRLVHRDAGAGAFLGPGLGGLGAPARAPRRREPALRRCARPGDTAARRLERRGRRADARHQRPESLPDRRASPLRARVGGAGCAPARVGASRPDRPGRDDSDRTPGDRQRTSRNPPAARVRSCAERSETRSGSVMRLPAIAYFYYP